MDCFSHLFADGFFEQAGFGPRLISLFTGIFSAGAWRRQGGMNRIGWRYRLTGVRSAATPGRLCGDGLRCAATRRHTSGTGVDLRTAYLEKMGCFTVKIRNNCRVFRCTVNWARARPRTAFIAFGAAASSGFSSVAVHDVHGVDYEFSINSVSIYLCQPRT